MFKQTFDKSMEEVKEHLYDPNCMIVDVRSREEYVERHIPEATLIELPELLKKAEMVLAKDKTLYVYCRSGQRSSKAVTQLRALGYPNVYNVGGIIHWPYATHKGMIK